MSNQTHIRQPIDLQEISDSILLKRLSEIRIGETKSEFEITHIPITGDLAKAIIRQVCELFHQRLLDEAGKELPTLDNVIKSHMFSSRPIHMNIYDDLKEQASTLLASKQAEIEQLKKERDGFKELFQNELIEKSNPNFNSKESMMNELQEVREEVDRLKKEIIGLHQLRQHKPQ